MMSVTRLWVILLALVLFAPAGLSATGQPSDYDAELRRYQEKIVELEASALTSPPDIDKATKRVYLLYWRASLMGDSAGLAATREAANRAIAQVGPAEDIVLLKANLDFNLHRLADAKQALALLSGVSDNPRVRLLQADIDFQEGRCQDAETECAKVMASGGGWDSYARMAFLRSKLGADTEAQALYAKAQDEITAKEMRSYAWVELQRGLLDLSRGRCEQAAAHYRQAEKAYSGYWLTDEHMAELLGAQGRYDEAAALYEKVILRIPRPEFEQALGDLYSYMGKPARAEPHYEKALEGYLTSVGQGEVQYFHHLAGFYADVRQDGAEAVKWARLDLALRPNFLTQDALSWAFYRAGRYAEALETMDLALASGWKDAQVFFHAAMICLANGQAARGKEFLRQAADFNPRYTAFHVHR